MLTCFTFAGYRLPQVVSLALVFWTGRLPATGSPVEKGAQGGPLLVTCSQQSSRGADGWEGGKLEGKTPEELQGGEACRLGAIHLLPELL